MITVTVTGTTPDKLYETVTTIYKNCQKGVQQVAFDSRNYMTNVISAGYRGQGKRDGSNNMLENAIQVEKINEGTYGVGNISQLNAVVPYWGLINSGGMVAVKARRVPGYFGVNRPPMSQFSGTGVGKEQFTYTPRGQKDFAGPGIHGGKTFLMVVDNPIGAVNYVEKTKDWLKSIMGAKFYSWTRIKSYK